MTAAIGLLLVSHSVRLAEGAAELAREMAPDVVVASAAGDVDGGLGTSLEKVTDALTGMFDGSGVDAVVVLCLPLEDHEVVALKQLDVPVAMVGVQVPGFSSVRIDDVAGGRAAMRHLLNLGHERIGLLRIAENGGANDHFPDHRWRGYQEALAERGLAFDQDLEQHDVFGIHGGARGMGRLLSAAELPTAVVVECDEMAFGALRTVRRAGLRVPEDVSVIGFDDHDMAEVMGLTTVRQPVPDQGNQAALLVLDALESPDGRSPSDVTVPTEVVIRESTAPPRGTLTGTTPRGSGENVTAPETTSEAREPHRRPPVDS